MYLLYTSCEKFDLLALYILVGSGKCRFFHIYLFVNKILLCSILCFMFEELFLCFFKKFCDFPCFFSTLCENRPFSFLVLWISVILFAPCIILIIFLVGLNVFCNCVHVILLFCYVKIIYCSFCFC